MDVTPPSQHEIVQLAWHEQFLSDRAGWTKDSQVASRLSTLVVITALAVFVVATLGMARF